jgi:hypothetical protein
MGLAPVFAKPTWRRFGAPPVAACGECAQSPQ